MKISRESVSREFIRGVLDSVDKFEHRKELLGYLYATQQIREIGRLHTWYPGQRTELDYTNYGIWLFPNAQWNEPVLYQDGIGIDHASGCIKGFTITSAPSSRDVIRLYKRCVLPAVLWLPDRLKGKAQNWDVFGLENLVAIDNAADLTSNMAMLMFMGLGSIVSRMPPKRGDPKGGVERTQGVLEQTFIRTWPGYIPKVHIGLDPRFSKARERAKSKASMTVADYEERMTDAIIEFNESLHPRIKKKGLRCSGTDKKSLLCSFRQT